MYQEYTIIITAYYIYMHLYIYVNIGVKLSTTNPDRCESGYGDKRHPTEKC